MKNLFGRILWPALPWFTLGFVGGIAVGIKRGVPFVTQREQWTTGIYRSDNPYHFNDL
jgi:hypothetical protein